MMQVRGRARSARLEWLHTLHTIYPAYRDGSEGNLDSLWRQSWHSEKKFDYI